MSRIEKTIARQKERIEEGQYYEAHQQLRVITSRYVKSSDWDSAISVLFGGAHLLLKAGQGGSGGDLSLFLLDVYNKAELKVDGASKGRLFTLLRTFPENEPTKKKFVAEAVGWTAKCGDYPAGDPELHHIAGQSFAEEGDTYEAERHLLLGTRDSASTLARLEYSWYTQDEDPSTAALYAARAILPYLLTRNLRAANASLLFFTSALGTSAHPPAVQEVSSTSSDVRIYPSLPLINFLSLMLLAVQRGSSDLWRTLKLHFQPQLGELEGAWDEALTGIGEIYFGERKKAQMVNPLEGLMGMFGGMGGGGGGGGGGGAKQKPNLPAPAPAPALD